MAGITFVNTILLSEAMLPSANLSPLLFHECVHVCQYDVLGVDAFVEAYVSGWSANGFDYYAIPLERDAYALQSAFELSRTAPLDVEGEVVRRQLGARILRKAVVALTLSIDLAHLSKMGKPHNPIIMDDATSFGE